MGERWVYEKQERNDNGYGDIYIDDSRAHRHDDYVRIHNADCDAYEARIAEMEEERDAAVEFAHATERAFCTANTELARVKAESLRVVPTEKHELGHYEVAMAVFIGGATMIYERYDSDDGELVRLEHWETEDGN